MRRRVQSGGGMRGSVGSSGVRGKRGPHIRDELPPVVVLPHVHGGEGDALRLRRLGGERGGAHALFGVRGGDGEVVEEAEKRGGGGGEGACVVAAAAGRQQGGSGGGGGVRWVCFPTPSWGRKRCAPEASRVATADVRGMKSGKGEARGGAAAARRRRGSYGRGRGGKLGGAPGGRARHPRGGKGRRPPSGRGAAAAAAAAGRRRSRRAGAAGRQRPAGGVLEWEDRREGLGQSQPRVEEDGRTRNGAGCAAARSGACRPLPLSSQSRGCRLDQISAAR